MNVLVLSRWFPFPANTGSKIRVLNMLAQLARRHEVALVTFGEPADLADPDRMRALRPYCARIAAVPYRAFRPGSVRGVAGLVSLQPRSLVDTFQPAVRDAVAAEVSRGGCDVLLASQLDMAPYAVAVPSVPAILEELELTTYAEAPRRAASAARRWRARLTWLKLVGYLRRVLPRFDACTVVSEHERHHLHAVAPGYAPVHVIPNAVDLAAYSGPFGPPQPDTLIYTGALSYRPNYDAVAYFVSTVFPLIKSSAPNARLVVTGATEGVDLDALPRAPGVEYTGYLADIRARLAESWLAVVPLRHGGGTRLKVLEAMALGTPVVATSKGAEGLEVTPGENILIADDPVHFARCVVDVLRSPEQRARLGAAGRQLVALRYDWAQVGQVLTALVERSARRTVA